VFEDEVSEGADASSVETDEAPEVGTTDEGTTEEVSEGSDDRQMVTVRVDGQDIEVPLDEALNGYMRQADYTRKTQEVANQRQGLEYEGEIVEALGRDPRATIAALASAYGLTPEQFLAQTSTAEVDEEELEPWEQANRKVESWIEEQEARQFEQYTRSELGALHDEYGDFQDDELIQFMLDRQIPDFRDAFTVFAHDRVMQIARKAQANAANQQRKEGLPAVEGGSHTQGGSVTPGGTQRFSDVRAAFEAAKQQHGL
jgi:hypothetical protein